MGQQANRTNQEWDVLDTVITNALIVDAATGIVKADIGIKVINKVENILNATEAVYYMHDKFKHEVPKTNWNNYRI